MNCNEVYSDQLQLGFRLYILMNWQREREREIENERWAYTMGDVKERWTTISNNGNDNAMLS